MDKQCGILIMRDENDILEEYLTKIVNYYDKILVLDGSDDDEGRTICSKFPEVIYYVKETEVDLSEHKQTGKKVTNSIRSILWEKAKELIDEKKWVAVLHPDEFPDSSPLELFEKIDAEDRNVTAITINNRHFFLHTSQKENWNFEPGQTIEDKLEWCMMPGWPEDRYFRFDKTFKWNGNNDSLCIPENAHANIKHVQDFFHNQATYRSFEQVKKRMETRMDSGWQFVDFLMFKETNEIFYDTLKWPDYVNKKYPYEASHYCNNKEWMYPVKVKNI